MGNQRIGFALLIGHPVYILGAGGGAGWRHLEPGGAETSAGESPQRPLPFSGPLSEVPVPCAGARWHGNRFQLKLKSFPTSDVDWE